MSSSNLLRLTDDFEDPMSDLKLAMKQASRSARRVLEQAVERGLLRDVVRLLWKPAVTVVETDGMVKVSLEGLGDLDRELVAVTLDAHGVLHMRARAKIIAPRANGSDRTELRSIERHIMLPPDLVRERATATFEGGRLVVVLPKRTAGEEESELRSRTRAA